MTFKEAWEKAKIGENLYREKLETWYIVKNSNTCHCKNICWTCPGFGEHEAGNITTMSIFANDWYLKEKPKKTGSFIIDKPVKATITNAVGHVHTMLFQSGSTITIEYEPVF